MGGRVPRRRRARPRGADAQGASIYVPIVGGVRRRHQRADGPDRHARADQRLPRRPADRRGGGDAPTNDLLLWSNALFQLGSLTARRRARARLAQRDARRPAHAAVGLHRHRRRRDAGAVPAAGRADLLDGRARLPCSSAAGPAATRPRGGRARPSRGSRAVAPAPGEPPRRRAQDREPAGRAESERSVTREDNAMATEGQTLEQQLEELLDQETFSPPEDFKEQAVVSDPAIYEQAEAYEDFWAERAEAPALGHQVGPGARLVEPAVRQVVRRRQAQRRLQLRRPPRRGRQRRPRRLPLARRGGRGARRHLRRPAPRRPEARQRAEGPRRLQGRRRRDLPADDPRGRGGDARLRADRRDPQRRVRRLQRRVGQGADRVLRGQDADHRRRRPPQGQDGADQGAGRRGDRRPRGHDRRRPARRQRRADEGRARPLVPRGAREGRRRVPGRADGRRGPALHPLHERLDGEAEGHPAHDRRLPDRRRLHARGGVRPQARGGRLLVRGRRRLGHRPQLHRLRAAGQRHDLGDVGGRAGLPGQGRVVGHRRALQGDDPLLRADRDPRVHEVGRRAPRGP